MPTAVTLPSTTDREVLNSLIEPAESPCVSIYLPTHGPHTEAVQDPVRMRNLLRDAKSELSARDLASDAVSKLVAPAEALVDDRAFWQARTQGLALFGCNGQWRTLRLPMTVEPEVVVGDVVSLRQLSALFEPCGRCLALVVDQRKARLFEVDRWSIVEIELPEIAAPNSEGGTRSDVQLRRAAAGPSDAAFFHGHGGAKDVADAQRDRFLREVAHAVGPILAKRDLPIVLGGDNAVTSAFRAMLHQNNIVGTIAARPERLDLTALHAQVWQEAQPTVDHLRHDALTRFGNLSGTGRAAHGSHDVASAAAEGRVDVLFLPPHHVVADDQQALVDIALIDTLRSSGDVIQRNNIDDAEPAAILRH